jgi:hypothetical protein
MEANFTPREIGDGPIEYDDNARDKKKPDDREHAARRAHETISPLAIRSSAMRTMKSGLHSGARWKLFTNL